MSFISAMLGILIVTAVIIVAIAAKTLSQPKKGYVRESPQITPRSTQASTDTTGISPAVARPPAFKPVTATPTKPVPPPVPTTAPTPAQAVKESSKKYQIDLAARTCTCPDWRETRSGYSKGEPMRLCKHLVQVVVDRGLHEEYGSEAHRLVRAAQNGRGYYPDRDPVGPQDRDETTPEGRRKLLGVAFGTVISEAQEKAIQEAFGGQGYIFTFHMYFNRIADGPVTLNVPRGDHYRWRMETLARTGIARRGSALTPNELLEGLKMADLRVIASGLGGKIKFRTKAEGIAKLAQEGMIIANHLPPGCYLDDFFRLEPLTLDAVLARRKA